MASKMVPSNECLFLSFLRRSNFIKTNNSILLDPLIEHKIPQDGHLFISRQIPRRLGHTVALSKATALLYQWVISDWD